MNKFASVLGFLSAHTKQALPRPKPAPRPVARPIPKPAPRTNPIQPSNIKPVPFKPFNNPSIQQTTTPVPYGVPYVVPVNNNPESLPEGQVGSAGGARIPLGVNESMKETGTAVPGQGVNVNTSGTFNPYNYPSKNPYSALFENQLKPAPAAE